VSVVADALEPLQQLAHSAAKFQTSVDVLVEVNVGQDRWEWANTCGNKAHAFMRMHNRQQQPVVTGFV
jgi:D-serine deaminase-like pyridoxal phosphate-dependent protein